MRVEKETDFKLIYVNKENYQIKTALIKCLKISTTSYIII